MEKKNQDISLAEGAVTPGPWTAQTSWPICTLAKKQMEVEEEEGEQPATDSTASGNNYLSRAIRLLMPSPWHKASQQTA